MIMIMIMTMIMAMIMMMFKTMIMTTMTLRSGYNDYTVNLWDALKCERITVNPLTKSKIKN